MTAPLPNPIRFSSSLPTAASSREIIAAFDEPANRQKCVITLEGKMVERLHLVMARRTVAIADGIEAMRRTEEAWF